MKFEALNDMIPYVMGGKEKILRMSPYPGVTLAMPGRHAKDTTPKGGDFVVMVSALHKNWEFHQFTHIDIFQIVAEHPDPEHLMKNYLLVVQGADPTTLEGVDHYSWTGVLLKTMQCLAVAEHRRYAKYELKFGGRFLPFRFAAGIAEGLWTAADAAEKQKKGRPGVEWLEKDFGTPQLTQELMK